MKAQAFFLLCLISQLVLTNGLNKSGKRKSHILKRAANKHFKENGHKPDKEFQKLTPNKDDGTKTKRHDTKKETIVSKTVSEKHGHIDKHINTPLTKAKRHTQGKAQNYQGFREPHITVDMVSFHKYDVLSPVQERERKKRSSLISSNGGSHSKKSDIFSLMEPMSENEFRGHPEEQARKGGNIKDHRIEDLDEDESNGESGSGGDNDEDYDSGDENGSGSGTTEVKEEKSKQVDKERDEDNDEDEVTQIVKNNVQGKGSKRQPKGEWVCTKKCSSPMSYEECAIPRCSFKIGTIKDLCFFLCKHQQPSCKEVCEYE